MDYRIFIVRKWSLLRMRVQMGVGHTDSESEQHFWLGKNSKNIIVLLTGFEPWSFGSKSDALPIEPPRHPFCFTCKFVPPWGQWREKRDLAAELSDLAAELSDFVEALHGQHVVDARVDAHLVHDRHPPLLGAATNSNRVNLVCLLKVYSPANRTGSPQGYYKTCTLHKHKTYKHNPKVCPFGSALTVSGVSIPDF